MRYLSTSALLLLLLLAVLLTAGQDTTPEPAGEEAATGGYPEPAAEPPTSDSDRDTTAENATEHDDGDGHEHDDGDGHEHDDGDGHEHAAEDHTESELDGVAYRAENTTELTVNVTTEMPEDITEMMGNTTEMMGNTTWLPGNTTDLPGNVTGPSGNSSDASLACYVCNSADEPVCADPFNAEAAEAADLLQECYAVPGLRTVCRKSWQMVPGDTRVVRSCGHDNDARSCFVTAEAVSASHVCHCFEDACNAAPVGRTAAGALLLLAAAAIPALR